MKTGLLWIAGGGVFGAALSFAVGNTPIGVAMIAAIGAVAGWFAERAWHKRRRG